MWRQVLPGVVAALCAVGAMAAVSVLGLLLVSAGAITSMTSVAPAITAMAVGGSVSLDAGSDDSGFAAVFGADGLVPSMSGAVDVVPLGVTLVGSVVLWFAYCRGLKGRHGDAGELAARAGGAVGGALLAVVALAGLGHGALSVPTSAMDGAVEGPLRELFGAGAGVGDELTTSYEVGMASAGWGAVVWVAVVLGVGFLISRRVAVPLRGVLDRLRDALAPGLPVVRMVLVLAAVPLLVAVPLVVAGAAVGGRVATVAGAVLLLAPNAVMVFLTFGVGAPWSVGGGAPQGVQDNPMAAVLGRMGGGVHDIVPSEGLADVSLSAGSRPWWPIAFVLVALALLACACAGARRGLSPRGGHGRFAGLFGAVTAVVLGGATWLSGASGEFGISMFGMEWAGVEAELSGSVLWAAVLGLFAGSVAGGCGSYLATRRGHRDLTP